MNPRQRRLVSDFKKMKEEFSDHPYISFETENNEVPPERYFVNFKNVKGLRLINDESGEKKELQIVSDHKIEIYLHSDYPRFKPQCNLLTGAFHPNFRMASPNDICIGEFFEYRMVIRTNNPANLGLLSTALGHLTQVRGFRISPTGD